MKANWSHLPTYKITAIEFNLIDRLHLILEIAKQYPRSTVSRVKEEEQPCSDARLRFDCQRRSKAIYFWNSSYDFLQNVEIDANNVIFHDSEYTVGKEITAVCTEIQSPAIFIFEGLEKFDSQFNYELRNYYFRNTEHQIILIDAAISIPLELYSMIACLNFGIPDLHCVQSLINLSANNQLNQSLVQTCFGLTRGEIQMLVKNQVASKLLIEEITEYKAHKLTSRGLKIVPKPDVTAQGLDLLDQDLEKIQKLFSLEAKERNLTPPKGCCLWGLPGTGKSLVAKMMSSKLNATLIACDWNQLLDKDLSRSLANLEYVLNVVDGIGNCVLFFDEFEKAFAGWNSTSNSGILAKMAGKLLTWMQDHTSPTIMLATINHLDMLPPELIRRFNYIWFFPSQLHDGAQWEVFQVHLEKHFPGLYCQFNDTQWQKLFTLYRSCSPAEIGGAVERTHHEIFFRGLHTDLTPKTLLVELGEERTRFKPAATNQTTSNALSKILMEADFARPVRGKDTSRFARPTRELFEKNLESKSKITIDDYEILFNKMVSVDSGTRPYKVNF
jgi:ATPase family associated with various cellular activities (AAA)